MTTEELKIKVKLDTSELARGVKQIKDTLQGTSSEFDGVSKATQNTAASTKAVTAAMGTMGATTVAQTAVMATALGKIVKPMAPLKSYIKVLKDDFKGLGAALGKDFDPAGDNKLQAWVGTLKTGLKEIGVTSDNIGKKVRFNLSTAFQNAKTSIAVSMTAIGASIAGVIGGITAFTYSLLRLSESTKEFRQAMNQINTSFIALGSNAETAQKAYEGFYRILGDVQRSTEAANLLAQITTGEKELYQWTKIATGALAMFPDSLPTESLIEASNETIKTAKVTGALADALNWPANSANKISKALEGSAEAQKIFNDSIKKGLTVEDAFNAVLAETNNQTQREVILRAALNGVYGESAKLYEKMNKELIAQNEAQYRLNQATAKLGKITQPLHTAFTNLKAALANALAPAIKVVCDWLVTFMNLLSKAIAWVGAFIAVIFPSAADAIESVFSGAGNAVGGVTDQTGGLTDSINGATGAAKTLKRTLMGFDELNVVSVMSNTDSGSAGGGASGGAGNGIDISGIDTGESVFKKAQEELDHMKEKVKAFLEEWKTEIGIIAAALGTLGVASLITSLGKALGLGEKFLAAMGTIKKLAATAITIVLQYTLVNEFMDNYIDGEGFKEYLKGLVVAAIGTGVLYAMWGTPGLIIGLGVTAVASIKAVIDNGGITSVESATVALTGLAAALGAIGLAWKPLVTAFNGIKAVIGSLAGNSAATSALAFLPGVFSKITGMLQPIVTGFTTLAASIGAVFGATGSAAVAVGAAVIVAAIAAVASGIYFAKENWDKITAAVKQFFDNNIAPKLENIKESFRKIGEALGPVGTAIVNIVKAIGEWFASIDWLETIGKVFEGLGGIIFGAVSGVIAGAISTLVTIFDGAVQAISGAVQIISNAIKAIVKACTGDFQGALDACKKIVDGIVDLFKGLYKMVVEPVKEFVKGVIDWFIALWDELVGHSIVPDTIDGIVKCFTELPGRVYEKLKAFVQKVIAFFQELWKGVSNATSTKLAEIRTTIINAWNNIKNYFTTNIAPKFTIEYWKNKFDTLRAGAQQKLGELRTQIMNSWNSIREYFNTNIAPKFTLTYWKNKLDTIRSAASAKIGEAKTAFQNGWNHIVSWFNTNVKNKFTVSYWQTKFNTIKDGARSAFNGIISIVETAVNRIINKINTLSWKIPDWVPSIGGKYFGFNFKTISIPRLATGGIVTQSVLANIGENGREAVLPLDRNTEWMDQLADRIAARQQTPTRLVLKVGEKELGWASINGINQITKQTGELQLVL